MKFINGVHLISESEIIGEFSDAPYLKVFTLIVILIMILILSIVIVFNKCEKAAPFITLIIALVLCIILMIGVCIKEGTYESNYRSGVYEYKVTIDDSVSFNEFNERYEITNQEGKIYTIRIKDEIAKIKRGE